MPKRIAFRSITSGRDTGILDHSGAETLLSKGEMIFADLNEENHLQGAYVSQQEIKAVVDACIEQYKENPNNNNTDINNKEAKIDVNIIVEYGARIPEVAFEIQSRVKKSVENMTGLKVLEVNVHVQGVHAVTEEKTQEEENESNEE